MCSLFSVAESALSSNRRSDVFLVLSQEPHKRAVKIRRLSLLSLTIMRLCFLPWENRVIVLVRSRLGTTRVEGGGRSSCVLGRKPSSLGSSCLKSMALSSSTEDRKASR